MPRSPDSITNGALSPIIEEFGIQYPPIGRAVAVTRVLGSQFTGCHLHCDSLSLHYRLLSDHRRRESMTSTRSRIATSRLFSLQTNQCDQRRQLRARSRAPITREISLRWTGPRLLCRNFKYHRSINMISARSKKKIVSPLAARDLKKQKKYIYTFRELIRER